MGPVVDLIVTVPLCSQHEKIVAFFYTRLQTFSVEVKIRKGFLNSDHENILSGVHELLKDAVSINNIVQRLD